MDDVIGETLNIKEEIPDVVDVVPVTATTTSPAIINVSDEVFGGENKNEDGEMVRTTFHQLITAGQSALEGALEVANNTRSPRAYEVVATIFKNLAESSEKLLDLHEKSNTTQNTQTTQSINGDGTTINKNTFFIGSTADLQVALDEMPRNDETTE